jgi:hypothetical protein
MIRRVSRASRSRRAWTPEGVVDIFAAPGLQKPDISILSQEFLAEVRGIPQRNLAVELLHKLLKGELATRRRKNIIQARSFAEIWDIVGFDEVADLQKMPKEVITTMKTYCESGTFQRGQEAASPCG